MDFALSEQHEMLRQTVRAFAEQEICPTAVQRVTRQWSSRLTS